MLSPEALVYGTLLITGILILRRSRRAGLALRRQHGLIDGQLVQLHTLTNARGMEVSVSEFGATLTSIRVPDIQGRLGEVTLGLRSLEDYVAGNPFLGSTVGRYANRLANGQLTIDGRAIALALGGAGATVIGTATGAAGVASIAAWMVGYWVGTVTPFSQLSGTPLALASGRSPRAIWCALSLHAAATTRAGVVAEVPDWELLRDAAAALPAERVSMQTIAKAHGPAAHGTLLLMTAVPCLLPVPGVGTVLGLGMAALAAAMERAESTHKGYGLSTLPMWGMAEKAMQAEQSKAEKLNKLASLHQICAEQDDQIAKLKQRIRDML
mgnify:CR=1 FL=1